MGATRGKRGDAAAARAPAAVAAAVVRRAEACVGDLPLRRGFLLGTLWILGDLVAVWLSGIEVTFDRYDYRYIMRHI